MIPYNVNLADPVLPTRPARDLDACREFARYFWAQQYNFEEGADRLRIVAKGTDKNGAAFTIQATTDMPIDDMAVWEGNYINLVQSVFDMWQMLKPARPQ